MQQERKFKSKPEADAYIASLAPLPPLTFAGLHIYSDSYSAWSEKRAPVFEYIVRITSMPIRKSDAAFNRQIIRDTETSGPYRGTYSDEAVGF